MNEPLEEVLRRSLTARAAEREPGLDLTRIHGLARRHRNRRRTFAAGVILAVLAVPSAVVLNSSEPDRLDVAEQSPPLLAAGELTSRALAALGEGATVLVPEGDLPLGPVEIADAYASGEATRVDGRVVTIRLDDDGIRTYAVRWETLRPPPTDDALRRGMARMGGGDAAVTTADVGGGRSGYAVPVPNGVAAATLATSRTVIGVDLLSGDLDADQQQLMASALSMLAALTR